MCSQVYPISATRCIRFDSMNILQHCPSDFAEEPAPGYTSNILVHNLCNMSKKCCVASVSKRSHM